MRYGTPFEVEKEVYDRAKAAAIDKDKKYFYLTKEDEDKLFSPSIINGYGLYRDTVHEQDGKYIVEYMTGSSCD